MMNPGSTPSQHLLVYEPRVEGHHPGWLRFITEDLLSGGCKVTLALDLRPDARRIIEDSLDELLPRVQLIAAVDDQGRRRGGSTLRSVQRCLAESGAARVFLCEFDELASATFRRAALGRFPPAELKGRLGGIYHRPRFMAAPRWSLNRWLKQSGFRRLLRDHWFNPILFLDEYLTRERQQEFPGSPLHFLPNPCPPDYSGDRWQSRQALGVPADRCVFLFYGGGYRRKGFHLTVEAMQGDAVEPRPFLLAAGRLNPDPATRRALDEASARGDALLLNRYVSSEEERHCFAASDFVLLPYINHFGISAVLAQAVAARKPVIASDEQLLGRQVKDNRLGLLFHSHDVPALRAAMREAMTLGPQALEAFRVSAERYALRHSRAAYRQVLLHSLNLA